jgi:hypothetical protein
MTSKDVEHVRTLLSHHSSQFHDFVFLFSKFHRAEYADMMPSRIGHPKSAPWIASTMEADTVHGML